MKYNRKYLKHNTLTDIITFPAEEEEGLVSGDIYISLPRVKENARKYKQRFKDELNRVMIHGILHLIGYDDQKAKEKENMHKLEDHYLARLALD